MEHYMYSAYIHHPTVPTAGLKDYKTVGFQAFNCRTMEHHIYSAYIHHPTVPTVGLKDYRTMRLPSTVGLWETAVRTFTILHYQPQDRRTTGPWDFKPLTVVLWDTIG